jgi:two-component system, OmpR family, response regulator MtrA
MATTGTLSPTVLLVEDDPAIVTMLTDALGIRGYLVCSSRTAAEAGRLIDELSPDVILLDLALPDGNGLLLCANLRAKTNAPIIVCSASKQQDDRILGFKLGADDFVGKPFCVEELAARIEAVLRRANPAPRADAAARSGRHEVGRLVIDEPRCRVMLDAEEVRLTPTEYRLLCLLASRQGEVLSRKELAERVWGYHDPDVGRSLEVHMRRLRAKLEAGSAGAPRLVTLRGFGYQLQDEPEGVAASSA